MEIAIGVSLGLGLVLYLFARRHAARHRAEQQGFEHTACQHQTHQRLQNVAQTKRLHYP